jgi:protein SCO1/2
MIWKSLGLIAAMTFFCSPARAYNPDDVNVTGHELPKELQNVGVDQHLGDSIDLSLTYTDDKGESVSLSRYFHKDKPVVMAMVYYSCPSLCNYHLNGLTDAMKTLKWTAGDQFEVVAVSMNSAETPELAARKKQQYLAAYGRVQAENGWHFLVGNKANVQKLADELGFKFKWLPERHIFAHASVTYVLTPEGKISRFMNGIQPDPTTLKLSLLKASNGKIGTLIDQALMFCFKFNPHKNKYTLYAYNVMRIGGAFMVLLMAMILIPLWWRDRGNNHKRT